ncbi:Uncharacterised protein [BD1-7 clade bacterium]|uniref:Nif11 domain-containing protein n=1 Tax=BD1-7 clade bacterium TaxID=2029982 RepID=A0A5S9P433_9GAMM|nr:Uncharacterised protein [BD1-7 clade bacterium]
MESAANAPHVQQYQALFSSLNDEQCHDLAHIKRFLERIVGDNTFRDAFAECEDADAILALARSIGCDIDPLDILPLFHANFLEQKGLPEAIERWPKHHLWTEYIRQLRAHLTTVKEMGGPKEASPKLHRWRLRQIIRTNNQLGYHLGHHIVHPLITFELSDGCSVGCWFCGISAEKFNGYWPYSEENAALWQAIHQQCQTLMGTAMQTGFCYWATDPMDNPDYDKFLMDYYRAHNYLPQTTTAVPLRNIELTRRIIDLYQRYQHITNRFSVLNLKTLKAVHEEFTADEMMGVELVLHNKESTQCKKSNAGRAQEKFNKGSKLKSQVNEGDSTIACVSGFLVNMPKRIISMVTPVAASDVWPNGYRILGERQFTDADDFAKSIQSLVDEHCTNALDPSLPLAFRHDLDLHMYDGEVRSASNARIEHTFESENEKVSAVLADLLPLVAQATYRPGEIIAKLGKAGHNPLLVAGLIDNLFDIAMFEEDPKFLALAEPLQWHHESPEQKASVSSDRFNKSAISSGVQTVGEPPS